MKYIDIHGHLNFAPYDTDRGDVIERARNAGVGMISVGVDLESSRSVIELAEANQDMWATVALHPTNTGASINDSLETGIKEKHIRPAQFFDFDAFKKLAMNSRVVAIGECGLDYFHSKPEDIAKQREVFISHIELANTVGKPLMIHVRNGKDGSDAYLEAVELLKKYAKVKANFHFFAGNLTDLSAILDIGGSVSFTGVITFTHDYDELIRSVPLDRIMSETDCPYVAPVPYRGKRNEPSYVIEVVRTIAHIRGEAEDMVAKQLLDNARKFFGI